MNDFTTTDLIQADRNQRSIWLMARCEDGGPVAHEHRNPDEARQCAWQEMVDEALAAEPVQGPAPEQLDPEAPCAVGCMNVCDAQLIMDVTWNGMDGEAPCSCEHHTDPEGWQAAGVKWVREGR